MRLTNTGSVHGAKVLMAFAGEASARGALWGLRKAALAPGEHTELEFSTAEHDWCPLCTIRDGVRAVRPGKYAVRFGGHGSSNASRQDAAYITAVVALTGEVRMRPM